MSLTVLVAMVIAGVSLVVFAVHWSGGSARALIGSEQIAVDRLADDFEEELVRKVHITGDARSAFLLLDSGLIGIVHSVGDMYLTRCLQPSDIKRVERSHEKRFELELRDFTWTGGSFDFEDQKACSEAFERLQELANLAKEIA